MARVLVPLAPGFEEIEAVTIIDLLRRADIDVVTAGTDARRVTGNHGIALEADMVLDDALLATSSHWDMIALPGGQPGADNLARDARIMTALRGAADRGAFTAAICAAPGVLARAGLLENRRATSFPGVLEAMGIAGLEVSEAPVVRDDRIVTSRGPGTAIRFALALIEVLRGKEVRRRVADRLQIPAPQDVDAVV